MAVVKNNHPEAILLPIEDYKTMAEALSLLEHLEIYRLVQDRKSKKRRKTIGLDVFALPYRITLTADAADEVLRTDGLLKQAVATQLKKLETSPLLGEHLGNKAGLDLTGYYKLYAAQRPSESSTASLNNK